MEDKLVTLLGRRGPQTGAELVALTKYSPLALWRTCYDSGHLATGIAGRRYLRLDRAVDGYARLSPSIRREFLTYTVVGLAEQADQVTARVAELNGTAQQVSRIKAAMARKHMADILDEVGIWGPLANQVTFILAGDIVYQMAHTVPRPESSTGRMVRGSDLDVIIVTDDDFPAPVLRRLDEAIYRKKHYLLVHPDHQEEIDYVIKDLAKVRDQLAFDTFEHMVAAKIMNEGTLLCGSPQLFDQIKDMIGAAGIPGKLGAMTGEAERHRLQSWEYLLVSDALEGSDEHFHLFFTREESEEIY